MFIPARYTCNDEKAVHMFLAQLGLCPDCGRLEKQQQSCKRQIKIKVSSLIFYQLTMSLLVIDFTYLEGRYSDIVVKELAAVDFHSNSVASYVFKRPYGWEELPMFNARINEAFDHGCNWNDGDILYSELETVVHREVSSDVANYCFGPQKTQFIARLLSVQLLTSLS